MKLNSMPLMIFALVGSLVWAIGGCGAERSAPSNLSGKKAILIGWDDPSSEYLKKHYQEMEKLTPVDGVDIRLELPNPPRFIRRYPFEAAFANREWKDEWFDRAVSDLKDIPFKRFTDNFLILHANPGNVDWFDDDGWRAIEDHWRIAAEIVRKAKLKGIFFDPEAYDPPYFQFRYPSQPRHENRSFDDYRRMARQRGREVMEALSRADPNLTLLCATMQSMNFPFFDKPDPAIYLLKDDYGLYPAFIDGWLDAAPKTMTFVDGCAHAYHYEDPFTFYRMAEFIKNDGRNLTSPENQPKYASQVRVGFGLYLDGYLTKKGTKYYIDSRGSPKAERFKRILEMAMSVSDEYVWVYGEAGSWWPNDHNASRYEKWIVKMPNIDEALKEARADRDRSN